MALPAAHLGFEGSSRFIPDAKSTWATLHLSQAAPCPVPLTPLQAQQCGEQVWGFPSQFLTPKGRVRWWR